MPSVLPDWPDAATHAAGPVETNALQWETAPCPLCGSRRWSPVLTAPDPEGTDAELVFSVVRCCRCGLCFTNPRPTLRSIGHFYPAGYGPHVQVGLSASRRRRARWWTRLPAWLRSGCPERRGFPVFGRGRLLDVGCGGGAFLHRMHLQGWRVTGLDLSAAVVARIRAELGLEALAGTLPHPQLEPGGFDLITMWMSLEHMHRPRRVLEEVRRLLAPGGRLVVCVPNLHSVLFRWFGTHWFCLELPRHLVHFTPATLAHLLVGTGFEPQRFRAVAQSHWVRQSARLACRRGSARPWQRLLQHKLPSRLVAACSRLVGRADAMLVVALRRDRMA